MINIHERKCLTDRQKIQTDPISFYIWHIIFEQIQIFVSYIFRAAKLIQISKEHNTLLDKLPDQLKKIINWEDDTDIYQKVCIKIEEILQINFKEDKQFANKIEELRDIVKKEYEKFQSVNASFSLHSRAQQVDKSNQIINMSENTFLQDISYIQNLERKLNFKEQIVKPTTIYYQQFSRVQTNILNKINKIASFKDARFQKLEKIRQIESTIEQKLESIHSKLIDSSYKLRQLNNTQSQKHILVKKSINPVQINEKHSQRQHLQQLIATKIFRNAKQNQTRFKINISAMQQRNQASLRLDQQIKSNQLSQERIEKAKVIQNYFRKYLQNKQSIKIISKKQPSQTKIHNLQLNLKRIGSQSNHTSHRTERQKQGLVMITQQNMLSFLQRQKSLSKHSYQEKLQLAKQKKIQQAIQSNDIKIIQNSGFNFGLDDYNAKDEIQNTPLFYCAKHNLYGLCQFLLQNGANPNIKCSQGQTATHQACVSKNPNLLNLFTQYGNKTTKFIGADFNMPDDYGVTAQAIIEQEKISSMINEKDLKLNSYKVSSPKFDEFLVM
ncbi:unnamed protein product (macronuclear) [Paramecium tetraurelia]|uniref:Uncharacterized protein n=1 Tax=Paramecium tetraurelia TaxID=5888 RepID=A0C0N5_PARTE|nr:uncharacterized protein GSPATT00006205001 [Paramecium tetraurelia]CAK64352.1 unnamed protein product [Paramecium tetraurelia]|eukprot:XP_001431750.1 hypothetical protein (macronuclear) [Paramecium tetraurelia strain d4-2]